MFLYTPDTEDPEAGGIALLRDSAGATIKSAHAKGTAEAGNLFLRYWEEW